MGGFSIVHWATLLLTVVLPLALLFLLVRNRRR
jgi:hypothetical protein